MQLTQVYESLDKFFTAVLRDENPDPLRPTEWSLDFESKYHGMVMTYLKFYI